MLPTCGHQKILPVSGKKFNVGDSLDDGNERKLVKYFESFDSIFANEMPEINIANVGQCSIKTNKPIVCQSNKLTRKQNEMLTEKLSELLRIGVVQHSNSEWCSNAYAKEVNSGKLMLYVNYGKLNETIENLDFFIPSLEDEFRTFKEASIFSKIVIKDGFYQIPMKLEDKKKTAFKTELGKFEFNVMPYNLKNADKIFYKLLRKAIKTGDEDTIKIHSDEILVLTQDVESNLHLLKRLFKDLKAANFVVDLDESCFCVERVVFGGHQISSEGFTIGPGRLEKIRSFPIPKSNNEVSTFLELTNPFKRYVKNYQLLIQPLVELTVKKETFDWDSKASDAFYELITIFMSKPHLAFFKEGEKIRLETDVSLNGFTGSLKQKNDKDEWKPVSYCSSYCNDRRKLDCLHMEREATYFAMLEFETYLEEQEFSLVHRHGGLSFMFIGPLCHRLHRLPHLLFYKDKLDEFHESGASIRFEPDYETSKHETNVNCFDGGECYDTEVDQLYFSDSD